MEIKGLIRNPEAAHSALKEVKDSLIAVKRCRIYIPESYIGGPLGSIEDSIRIVGIYGIVVEDKYYAVSSALAIMEIEPSATNVVTIDNIKYMEFTFEVGDTVIRNINLIRTGTLVYRIYNEIIAKGKIPWYLQYKDLCLLFTTAYIHGNANLQGDSAILELIASSMARQKDDRTKFYRLQPGLNAKEDKIGPAFIPLRYVGMQATSTVARLLGAYFQEGVTSALISPSTRTESIEDILRT